MKNQCKVCANSLGNETFVIREMMFGTRKNFNYFKCSSCGYLQIFEKQDYTHKTIRKYKKFARQLNQIKDGDRACFIFQK